jgi:phosphoglycerate dehydrogenase-like enzyme
LMALLPAIDFLISERNQPVTGAMIAAAPRLKLIVRLGSLSHDIDRRAAHAAGIAVVIQPVPGTIFCAEHALMMILAVLKRLGRSLHAALAADHNLPAQRTDENTFAFNWLHYADIGGLFGKNIAILGMGEIGAELARRLRAFRPAVVYYHKRQLYPLEVEAELGIRYAALNDCLRRADVLVSLLPFGPETDTRQGGGIGGAALALMQASAVLVHLGSGGVLDEGALVNALRAGKLAGAALDTYEYEPLQPDHPLVVLARDPNANLLLTPHTAAASAPGDRSEDYAAIMRYLQTHPAER